VVQETGNNGNANTQSDKEIKHRRTKSRVINDGFDDLDHNNNVAMDDKRFSQLYESVRNQWFPGQRMKTLTKEFLNTPDRFSTYQAKQLVLLVNEEGNRLKLAKSSYHCITDPENFDEMNDALRFKTSREELDAFVNNGH
jgi:Domain of unknown function (DUF4476)